jgi:ribosome-binding factor A
MAHPFKRADRVSGLIQQELSRLLWREVKDPRLAQVTITAVRLSPDLRHARVLFRALSGPAALPGILEGLESARGFLRGELGRHLRLRYAPELSFEVDQSVEWSLQVAELLRQVQPGGQPPASPGSETGAADRPETTGTGDSPAEGRRE